MTAPPPLHPAYIRVVVDWAKLQPTSRPPPAWRRAGRLRARRGPCAPYAGLRDLLAAIASNPGLTPVIVIYGAPTWAALPASGCERPGTDSSSRPLAPAATAAYRRLVGAIVALGRSVGLELPWWSPWNEPNHPTFISPQRARCDPHARATSPVIYTTLARAMDAELAADRQPHRLVLGDLAGFVAPPLVVTIVGEFVADLPHDLVCGAGAWAVHYGLAGAHARRAEATVSALERALARTGCAGGARMSGSPRPARRPPAAAPPAASSASLSPTGTPTLTSTPSSSTRSARTRSSPSGSPIPRSHGSSPPTASGAPGPAGAGGAAAPMPPAPVALLRA